MRNRVSFDEVVRLLKEYKNKYGHCMVPVEHKTDEDVKLGRILQAIRRGDRKTTEEEKKILRELGFDLSVREIRTFEEIIEMLKEYKKEYGHCCVSRNHITADGTNLGELVQNIRRGVRTTTPEEQARLNDLGFVWDGSKRTKMNEVIKLLEEYKAEYGHCYVPTGYRTAKGINLGTLLRNIKSGVRKITNEEKRRLEELGFIEVKEEESRYKIVRVQDVDLITAFDKLEVEVNKLIFKGFKSVANFEMYFDVNLGDKTIILMQQMIKE